MCIRIVLATLCAALMSCASIVSKSDWPVAFSSPEPGTAFTVKNENGVAVAKGTTPATITLTASNGYFDGADYVVEANGVETPLESSMNGWYLGNIVFGGLIGLLIVDPLSGAMWTLPKTAHVGAVAGTPQPAAASASSSAP
jgi:hypothetical protein